MLNDYVFADALHGILLVLQLVQDKIDLPKGAAANDADEFKVIPCDLYNSRSSIKTT